MSLVFHLDYIKSVNCLGWYRHFDDVSLCSPQTWKIFPPCMYLCIYFTSCISRIHIQQQCSDREKPVRSVSS